ncbi:hypothetical protein GQX74_004940 [Glossina fuscipes]|nr:hypothetical protein GQX74_004940 [Glossina fuscipes]
MFAMLHFDLRRYLGIEFVLFPPLNAGRYVSRFCLGLRLTQEINFIGNLLDISNWEDLANCPYSLFCNETGYFQLLHVTANKYDIKGNLGDSITTYLGFALVGGLTAPPMFSDDAELTNRTNFLN